MVSVLCTLVNNNHNHYNDRTERKLFVYYCPKINCDMIFKKKKKLSLK